MQTTVPSEGLGIKPRFEFRSFGQGFEIPAKRMARLSMPVPENIWERQSDEIYIVSRNNDINNTKIRDGMMDIKTLVQTLDGLEQWNPVMKGQFPLTAQILLTEVFPAFGAALPELTKQAYSFDDFMELVRRHQDLQAVRVHKRRFAYLVNNTICETGQVLINGARVETISSESTETADVHKTLKDLGLEGLENINYLQAIKRVIGMIDQPLAN
ncbi:MAG TPA: hypothetical protein PKM27_03035 [Saprospiraceae bacterium]|nr:hypothetical protein [Saprospiraceae bacterium]HNT18961.1 hypothetical protein [Saprospiraceae bacterium]